MNCIIQTKINLLSTLASQFDVKKTFLLLVFDIVAHKQKLSRVKTTFYETHNIVNNVIYSTNQKIKFGVWH